MRRLKHNSTATGEPFPDLARWQDGWFTVGFAVERAAIPIWLIDEMDGSTFKRMVQLLQVAGVKGMMKKNPEEPAAVGREGEPKRTSSRPYHLDTKVIAWRMQKALQKLPDLPDRPTLKKLRELLQKVHDETVALIAKTEPSPEELSYIRRLERVAKLYSGVEPERRSAPEKLKHVSRGKRDQEVYADTTSRTQPIREDIDNIRRIEREAKLYTTRSDSDTE